MKHFVRLLFYVIHVSKYSHISAPPVPISRNFKKNLVGLSSLNFFEPSGEGDSPNCYHKPVEVHLFSTWEGRDIIYRSYAFCLKLTPLLWTEDWTSVERHWGNEVGVFLFCYEKISLLFKMIFLGALKFFIVSAI